MTVDPSVLISEIKSLILENNTAYSKEELDLKLTDDVDFIGAGFIDSFLFVELIGVIDEKFNISVDLAKINRDEMKTLAGFCTAVARQAR